MEKLEYKYCIIQKDTIFLSNEKLDPNAGHYLEDVRVEYNDKEINIEGQEPQYKSFWDTFLTEEELNSLYKPDSVKYKKSWFFGKKEPYAHGLFRLKEALPYKVKIINNFQIRIL